MKKLLLRLFRAWFMVSSVIGRIRAKSPMRLLSQLDECIGLKSSIKNRAASERVNTSRRTPLINTTSADRDRFDKRARTGRYFPGGVRRASPMHLSGEQVRAALRAGGFVPFFQPIVTLQTGEVAGMEVLARWQHGSLGVVPARSICRCCRASRT